MVNAPGPADITTAAQPAAIAAAIVVMVMPKCHMDSRDALS